MRIFLKVCWSLSLMSLYSSYVPALRLSSHKVWLDRNRYGPELGETSSKWNYSRSPKNWETELGQIQKELGGLNLRPDQFQFYLSPLYTCHHFILLFQTSETKFNNQYDIFEFILYILFILEEKKITNKNKNSISWYDFMRNHSSKLITCNPFMVFLIDVLKSKQIKEVVLIIKKNQQK